MNASLYCVAEYVSVDVLEVSPVEERPLYVLGTAALLEKHLEAAQVIDLNNNYVDVALV